MTKDDPDRIPLEADYRGPGPASVMLKTCVGTNDREVTYNWEPAYSIRPRTYYHVENSPGPVYNYDPAVTNRGRQLRPSYSLQSRQPTKGIEELPGPGNYNPHTIPQGTDSTEARVRCIGIGQKVKWPFKNEAPPSTRYTKPGTVGEGVVTRKYPAWSMSERYSHNSPYYSVIKDNNPGPGKYGTVDYNKIKRRTTLSLSLGGRTQQVNYNTVKDNPGPGHYLPKLPECSKKGCSMGVRHSSYMMPLITMADIF